MTSQTVGLHLHQGINLITMCPLCPAACYSEHEDWLSHGHQTQSLLRGCQLFCGVSQSCRSDILRKQPLNDGPNVFPLQKNITHKLLKTVFECMQIVITTFWSHYINESSTAPQEGFLQWMWVLKSWGRLQFILLFSQNDSWYDDDELVF